jgi:hypothetical protein
MMCLVHDLAEAQGIFFCYHPTADTGTFLVGDIAPSDGIPKATKQRLEAVGSISCLSIYGDSTGSLIGSNAQYCP